MSPKRHQREPRCGASPVEVFPRWGTLIVDLLLLAPLRRFCPYSASSAMLANKRKFVIYLQNNPEQLKKHSRSAVERLQTMIRQVVSGRSWTSVLSAQHTCPFRSSGQTTSRQMSPCRRHCSLRRCSPHLGYRRSFSLKNRRLSFLCFLFGGFAGGPISVTSSGTE